MTTPMKKLLLGTALTLPFAGSAVAQDAEACLALEQIASSDMIADTGVSSDDLMTVAEAGNAEECDMVLMQLADLGVDVDAMDTAEADAEAEAGTDAEADAEATAEAEVDGVAVDQEQAIVRLEDEVVIQGTVYLDMNAPEVQVEEGSTEIDISTAPADVTVTEQAANIVVRQAAPQITVTMPTPTIRIEQAAPEIIITMPEPGVDVASARPTVEVRQSEPVITVMQAQPGVELELRRAEEGEDGGFAVADRDTGEQTAMNPEPGEPRAAADANVTITESEPVVTYTETEGETANVTVNRAQPTVTVESAEPEITFESGGEPQIEYVQTGEAIVTINEAATEMEEAEGDDQAAAAMDAEATEEEAEMTEEAAEEEAEAVEENAEEAAAEVEAEGEETAAEVEAETEEAAAEVEAEAEETAAEVEAGAEEAAAEVEAETEEAAAEVENAAEEAEAATEEAAAEVEAEAEAEMAESRAPQVELEGYATAEMADLTTEMLTGADVYGTNEEEVGDVGELILSDDGQIQQVIIDVGGFLGLGEKQVALPLSDVQILRSEDGDVRVYTNYTEEELDAMPEYEN